MKVFRNFFQLKQLLLPLATFLLGLLINNFSSILNNITNLYIENDKNQKYILEHRPKLELEIGIVPPRFNGAELHGPAYYGGAIFTVHNIGGSPATTIFEQTEWKVTSDAVEDSEGYCTWARKNYGNGCDKFTLGPNQHHYLPIGQVISSGRLPPKLVHIGAVVAYRGPHSKVEYWANFSQVIALISCGEERPPIIVPLGTPETDWDNNSGTHPPKLKIPNLKERLTNHHLQLLLQGSKACVTP